MNGIEIRKLITENGFYPIAISTASSDSSRPPRFDGTLDEFWSAAKALEAKVVFLNVMQMDDSDFEREVPSDSIPNVDSVDDGEFDGKNYAVDLEEVLSSISRFREHLGKDCAFVLLAKGGIADLDFLITESWWNEFQDEAEKAVQSWMNQHNEQFEKLAAEQGQRTSELLGLLNALISDRDFCLLKTQRAMLAYAIEKIPDLEELEETILKTEIQTLRARIEAKGLNRKARD